MPPEALDRSFPINMQRRSSEEHPRRRFDERDRIFSIVREEIKKWAPTCLLSQDPEMPPALRDRAADICRPLLAVADCLGYGDKARAVLVDHFAGRPDEDPAVVKPGVAATTSWKLHAITSTISLRCGSGSGRPAGRQLHRMSGTVRLRRHTANSDDVRRREFEKT